MFALEIIQARGGSHNQSLWFETCTSDKKIKEKLEKGLGIVFITSGLFKISQE